MDGHRSDRSVRQFGDVDVTILLDMSVPFTGLETVTAEGVSNIVSMPGEGTRRVRLQRLGQDGEPVSILSHIEAGYLSQVSAPMQWVNWWQRLEETPRHVVVLAIHEICSPGYVEDPKRSKLLPLALAVGVAPDIVHKFSSIPQNHVLHVPVDKLAQGWKAVYNAIERVSHIPNPKDPRVLDRLAFTTEDHQLVDPKLPESAYARHIGLPRYTRVQNQRRAAALHAR